MIWKDRERPSMKARKRAKKRVAKKAKRAWGVRNQRATKAFARKKGRPGEGVIDLFVSTYQALG